MDAAAFAKKGQDMLYLLLPNLLARPPPPPYRMALVHYEYYLANCTFDD